MRVASAVACAICLMGAAPAGANAPEPSRIYDVDLAVDGGLLAASLTLSAGWLLRADASPAWCAPDCSPFVDRINEVDRSSAGNWSRVWIRASDAGYYAAFVATSALLVTEAGGVTHAWPDLVVMLQAMLLSNSLSITAQAAAGRPRPYMYSLDAPLDRREKGDGDGSFLSGHVAGVFAMTAVVFDVARRRRPHSGLRWLVLSVGVGLGTYVGGARVLAGYHFPTDVALSAVFGYATGVVVAAVHGLPVSPVVTADQVGFAYTSRF